MCLAPPTHPPRSMQVRARCPRACRCRRPRDNSAQVIDRDEIWKLKLAALETIWMSRPRLDEFDRWYAQQPPTLERFATWCALVEVHGTQWREWPVDVQSAAGARSQRAADGAIRDRARFYAWLQWIAADQLRAATDGSDVALVQDLPIGVDPDGFDSWAVAGHAGADVSVGAPPDEFNAAGQDWGLTPFIPYRLRAAALPSRSSRRSAACSATRGGLRIDHVMGLFRLFWVPRTLGTKGGSYVRSRADELLAIVALESQRAARLHHRRGPGHRRDRACARSWPRHRMLSYRLLYFEPAEPRHFPALALSSVTTHDLPTIAGCGAAAIWPTSARPGSFRTRRARRRCVRVSRRGWPLRDTADDDAVMAAHDLLGHAPCTLLAATLDDAIGAADRPNIPGADGERPNWSLALPEPLEVITQHPLATRTIARS